MEQVFIIQRGVKSNISFEFCTFKNKDGSPFLILTY